MRGAALGTLAREFLGLNAREKKSKSELFFRDGWGDERILAELSDPAFLMGDAKKIRIRYSERETKLDARSFEAEFLSPVHPYLPEESKTARVRVYLPKSYTSHTPVCTLFAMTGDQGYKNRLLAFSKPLMKLGIGTVLLENAYYGSRRPANQSSYKLSTVQDMLTMSVASVEEGKSIVAFLRSAGFHNLGVAGVSQGGMVAAVVGSVVRHPIAIAVSLAAHSPEVIFTEGLLRHFVDWNALGVETPQAAASRFKKIFGGGDITGLPTPAQPHSALIQGALRDLVVPRYSVKKVHQSWDGSHIRWLSGSHLTSIALHASGFQKLVRDSFLELQKALGPLPEPVEMRERLMALLLAD